MNKKAQILIISLWILMILSILAISIGHRVSMALRLSAYQKRRLQATYLAKAALTKARAVVSADSSAEYDGNRDQWADNETHFKKISLEGNEEGFATVSYTVVRNGQTHIVYGIQDEERNINLNHASAETLTALLNMCNAPHAQELANEVLAWRGESSITVPEYQEMGYSNKGEEFSAIEELIMVKNMTPEIYNSLKSLITVYGAGKVNINTAPKEVLMALGLGAAKSDPQIKENDAIELAARIISFRDNESGYFTTTELNTQKIREKLKLGDITSDEKTKIVDYLVTSGSIAAVTQTFRIEATGYCGKSRRRISVVIQRTDPPKILFWHEN